HASTACPQRGIQRCGIGDTGVHSSGDQRGGRGMLHIRRMGPQIGIEVTGIDVKVMDEAISNRIYQAWLDHNVMVVRDQELTIPDFIAYSERFGPVTPHPSKSTRHPEHPQITMLGVNKFDAEGK